MPNLTNRPRGENSPTLVALEKKSKLGTNNFPLGLSPFLALSLLPLEHGQLASGTNN
jgi:hypothetical protein